MTETRRIVTQAPENSETPLEMVRGWVTPTHWFFVRNHFDVPDLDERTWNLSIEGLVERPRVWTFAELTQLPERTVLATMECAGNGRSFLAPKQPGVPWGAGAIGHAEWTGIPLHLVLETVGVKAGALEVLFEGADQGVEPDYPEPLRFARSLPLEKALHPDTLLVTHMNGERLHVNHGFPVRLLVPGWYGVASVKWLERIAVIDHAFRGYFQSKKYTVATPAGRREVVKNMRIKSEIIRPRPHERIGLGATRVVGLAWGGEESLARVEISTDGGRHWQSASLVGPRARYSWNLWEFLWNVTVPGRHVLMSRAVSESGKTQPREHDPLHEGYLVDFCRPLEIEAEVSRRQDEEPADFDGLMYDINAYSEENARFPLDVNLEFSLGEGI